MDWNINEGVWLDLCDWADAFLFHFVGWERTPVRSPLRAKKPWAFRNSNIHYYAPEGRFYCLEEYNANSLKEYDMLASSHLGAQDFLGKDCRFLPALLDLDEPLLRPNHDEKEPCIGFTKHADILLRFRVQGKKSLRLQGKRPEVLHTMRKNCTWMVDNVSDGHYGLASMEAMAMGITPVCYNHPRTVQQICELGVGLGPWLHVPMQGYDSLLRTLMTAENPKLEQQRFCRQWMENYYNAPRLIERYWDKFLDDLMTK